MRMHTTSLLVSGLLLTSAVALADASSAIDAALRGEHRTPTNVERDPYRHPKEVLTFFGLEPDMTVVEIWPSGGWWTEVLAPVLRGTGQYFAAGFAMTADRTPAWRKRLQTEYAEKLEDNPEVYDHVVVTELAIPERPTMAPPGSADLILTFRNVHNWVSGNYAQEMFDAFHRTLKPGGVLGVVEHRARLGTSLDAMEHSGYVTEAYVIERAEAAGFELEARSEINANPKDGRDHPAGVWTLPPTYRHCRQMDEGEDQDTCYASYREIGESDRMTLKFRKPRS